LNTAQIRYFVTAAQLQNLSKAAEYLHISQPALSKSIAKLEEELGTPLFIREGKRITLNPAGKLFLENAWGILRNLDNALLELNQLKSNAIPIVSIGLCEPHEDISSCIAEFALSHPEVEFDIKCTIEADENHDINRYDMLFCPNDSKFSKFKGIQFGKEAYLVAVPSNHPLSEKTALSTKDIEGQPFVFLSHEKRYIEEPYYTCLGLNISMKARYLTNNRLQHQQFISSGIALGFVSENCAAIYKKDPHIKLLPILSNKFKRSLMVCFKRDKHLSSTAKEFRKYFIEKFNLESNDEQ